MPYALIRPDRTVRQTSDDHFDLGEFPGHSELPLTGFLPGIPLAAFSPVPADATEVTAPYALADVQVWRKAAVTERRKTERDRGVVVSGNRWHSDEKSVGNVDSYINTGRLYEAGHGSGTYRVRWKTLDGFVTATLLDLQTAQLAIVLFVQGCFAHEDALNIEIDAAETAESVLSISLDVGWPDDNANQNAAFVQALQQANARLERQAKELEQQGDVTGAQLLRLQIKEI